jgi:hypothetical protein
MMLVVVAFLPGLGRGTQAGLICADQLSDEWPAIFKTICAAILDKYEMALIG